MGYQNINFRIGLNFGYAERYTEQSTHRSLERNCPMIKYLFFISLGETITIIWFLGLPLKRTIGCDSFAITFQHSILDFILKENDIFWVFMELYCRKLSFFTHLLCHSKNTIFSHCMYLYFVLLSDWIKTFEFIESVRSNSWVLVSIPSLFGFHIKRKLQLFGFLGLPLERTVGLDWGGSERLQHPASALWSLLPHPAQHLHLPEYITCPPPPYVP